MNYLESDPAGHDSENHFSVHYAIIFEVLKHGNSEDTVLSSNHLYQPSATSNIN